MLNKPTFQDYYGQVNRMVRKELDKERPEYLLQVDFEEYLQHLIDKMAWETLDLDEGSMTMEPLIAKKRLKDHGRSLEAERPLVRLRIPASPHSQRREFLELIPSTFRLSGEPQWRRGPDCRFCRNLRAPARGDPWRLCAT